MRTIKLFLFVLFLATSLSADGLLIPQSETYPGICLRNRVTQVEIDIRGIVAETQVYQEFINESNDTTNAVYSFPLPPDARAIKFLYWYDGIVYQAVLKERQQAVNPGTGGGGEIAEINNYMGRNVIRVMLKNIAPGAIQKIKLWYLSHCDYYNGAVNYTYPLDTEDFIDYPLEHLQFNVQIQSRSPIVNLESTHGNFTRTQPDSYRCSCEWLLPKSYPARDFGFTYRTRQDSLTMDLYSCANDSVNGHFALYAFPQCDIESDKVLNRRIIFAVNTSSDMYGARLEQCVAAVKTVIEQLNDSDVFNVLSFAYNVHSWKDNPVPAIGSNIESAKTFLNSLSPNGGSSLNTAIDVALEQITDDSFNNIIMTLGNGRSRIDPKMIADQNTFNAGIFPIGIGDEVLRARLEMTAGLNHGFVTYFQDGDPIREGIIKLYQTISRPVMKDVVMEFGGAQVNDMLPTTTPSMYAGSYLFLTGRYDNSPHLSLAMAGRTRAGQEALNFALDFNTKTDTQVFVQSIWAKEMIDHLEREIEIYGETEALKEQVVRLSLLYNIRSRYTAYVADYETEYTSSVQDRTRFQLPRSHIISNYPNPFNPVTWIKVYLAPASSNRVKVLRIYNMLGQLVRVIDITHLSTGFNQIKFDGCDYTGQPLASGQYIVQLQAGEQISSIRITLLR